MTELFARTVPATKNEFAVPANMFLTCNLYKFAPFGSSSQVVRPQKCGIW